MLLLNWVDCVRSLGGAPTEAQTAALDSGSAVPDATERWEMGVLEQGDTDAVFRGPYWLVEHDSREHVLRAGHHDAHSAQRR